MHLQQRFARILCGAAIVCAFAVAPAIWALLPASGVGLAASMSAPRSHSDKLDINTATADQLSALPGSGPVYAKRIIAGRPYGAKNQLISKGILPQAAYDKIKDEIVAHHAKK